MQEVRKVSATKHDTDKLNLSLLALLPQEALLEVAEVIKFGADKYGMDNWRAGMHWTRLSSALLRHVFAWLRGEDRDTESGRHHLAHAVCCALFLLTYQAELLGEDDREF